MNAAHTPTPWAVHPHHSLDLAEEHGVTLGHQLSETGSFDLYTDDGHGNGNAVPLADWQANADFIVRACNSHDALMALLKDRPYIGGAEGHAWNQRVLAVLAAAGETP